jgi:hypothetical protein
MITELNYFYFLETKKIEISFAIGGKDGFIVWDETYSDIIGLFPTYFEAKANLKEYVETYLGQEYID